MIIGLIYLLMIGYCMLLIYYGSSVDDVVVELNDYLIEMMIGDEFEYFN